MWAFQAFTSAGHHDPPLGMALKAPSIGLYRVYRTIEAFYLHKLLYGLRKYVWREGI